MKNFLFIVFSVFAFTLATFSCTQTTHKIEAKKVDSTVKVTAIDVTDSVQNLAAQNFVPDSSYTSIQSSVASAQNLAKQIDDATYKASLTFDKFYEKIRKIEEMNKKADEIITLNSMPYNPTHHVSDYWLSKRSNASNVLSQDTTFNNNGLKLSYEIRRK